MEILKDQNVTCKDCATSFLLTAKEQEYFLKKKWLQPRRCKVCRKINREKKDKTGVSVR